MQNSVIIIGGGASVLEGVKSDLWNKIKGREIWSLNSVFKAMPYLPNKQLWVDPDFFKHEIDNLQSLFEQGVELVSREHHKLAGLRECIKLYQSTTELKEYHGKKALDKNTIFRGRMALCGIFALSLAIAKSYENVYLLGYDFGSNSVDNRQTHWYQDRITELGIMSTGAGRPEVYRHKQPERFNKVMDGVEDFEVLSKEPDIKIWNVSPDSNIPYFPKIDYLEFFKLIGA